MLSLSSIAELAGRYPADLRRMVGPLDIGEQTFDVDRRPLIMGTVNLSRDSTYRESVAVGRESAVRKARAMVVEGAAIVDIGAESSTAKAKRITAGEQIASLVPVIEDLAGHGVVVSVETYEPSVVAAALGAGAQVLNMTGVAQQEHMLDIAAEHGATVILCYSGGADVREVTDVDIDTDPIPGLVEHFAARLDLARSHGVHRVVIDPGMGFYYGNLTDPLNRARHQARVLLNGFRLKVLGVPVCNALPHAFDLFEENFRTAEGFFAVLACLGGTSVLRTHEVAQVRAVVGALGAFDAAG